MIRVTLTVAALLLAETAQGADHWKFGVAKSEITPTVPLMMSGYASRDQPNDKKLTELWAKALVLEDSSGDRVCIITADLIGVSADFSADVALHLKSEFQLDRHQFLICCSHTHTGPAVANTLVPMYAVVSNAAQTKAIETYTQQLKDKIVEVVRTAMASMEAGSLTYGRGEVAFATNRRNNRPESDVPNRRRRGTLVGPFDHDVPVLAVRDQDSVLRAVLFGYACHATVLSSYEWSGDYPGFAQEELELAHPQCQAMFWAGCGADQNPLPRRSVDLARHYGAQLASAVNAVILTTEMLEVEPELSTKYREIELAFDETPSEKTLRSDAKSKDRFIAGRADLLLQQLKANGKLPSHYTYPISVMQLGKQIDFVGLGGEVVVDFSLRLKRVLGAERTWVAAYTNDVMAYIPSRRVWQEGGYEGGGAMVYYGLPSRWAPSVENEIVAAVTAAVKENHRSGASAQ